MAKYTKTLTVDADVAICQIDRRRVNANAWQATVFIYGGGGNNFGSGTVVIKISPDGGTTKIATKDWNGTAISATAAAQFCMQPVGNGTKNTDFITVYASLTGSTSPTIIVDLFDNR